MEKIVILNLGNTGTGLLGGAVPLPGITISPPLIT